MVFHIKQLAEPSKRREVIYRSNYRENSQIIDDYLIAYLMQNIFGKYTIHTYPVYRNDRKPLMTYKDYLFVFSLRTLIVKYLFFGLHLERSWRAAATGGS